MKTKLKKIQDNNKITIKIKRPTTVYVVTRSKATTVKQLQVNQYRAKYDDDEEEE